MNYLEIALGLAALLLRAVAIPARDLPGDWIGVAALLWIGQSATRDHPRLQAALPWAAGAWLAVLYAIHQGRWTMGAVGLG